MSEQDREEPKSAFRGIARFVVRFLLEWAFLVGAGAAISIAADAAWSLIKPETAEPALLKLRQGFVPWAAATFVGMAVYKFLKRDKDATFNGPPFY